jgi:hypothetical protein
MDPMHSPDYSSGGASSKGILIPLQEGVGPSSKEVSANIKKYVTQRGVQILSCEDTSPHSASMCVEAPNKNSSAAYTRRILSLDGGGIRGLYEIAILSVLECLSGHPTSEHFDVIGGTSTGAILAAGSVSRRNYSAMDLLYLYGRYGYKIFDEQQRSLRGLSGAIYDVNGVDDLLVKHFGNDTLQDIKNGKRLYVVGFDSEAQEAVVYTSHEMTSPFDQQHGYHKTPMLRAIGVSTAAPVYFEARSEIKGDKKILMKDGGLVANNPSYLILQSEVRDIPANYEVYSLGTGLVPATVGSGNSGYLGAGKVIEEVFAAQVSAVERNCRQAVEDSTSELRFYARLQARLEAGKGDMDNTSPEYIQYAINKAFEVTRGPVFMNMLERLGIRRPTDLELHDVHKSITHLLNYSLSGYKDPSLPIYQQLSVLEKEFVERKLKQRDFDCYVKLSDAKGNSATSEAKEKLLTDIIEDLVKKHPSTLVTTLAGWFGVDTVESIKEMVLRGSDFHQVSKPLPKFELDHVHGGITKEAASQLFTEFEGCLSHAKYKYERSSIGSAASYFDLVAKIYWKNKFYQIKHAVPKENLEAFCKKLRAYAEAEITGKSLTGYSFLANTIYGSNAKDLVKYLEECIRVEECIRDHKL